MGEPAVVDFNGLFRGSNLRQARHLATLKVNLTQPEDRNISSSKLVRSLRAELKQSADKLLPNTVVKFVEDPPGPPVRATLEAKIKGSDRKVLTQVASDLARIFKQENKVEDIDTSIESSVYRTVYKVDHEKAMSAGISTFQIINTLKSLLGETPIGQYQLQNQYEILMADLVFSSDKKDQIQDLSEVFLKNQQGQMVPLESLVIASQSRQDGVLFTDQQEPTVYVTAEMGNRSVVYAVIDIIPKILNYEFPNQGKLVSWNLFGFTFETIDKDLYEIEWGGEWKMTLENFRDLGLAMLVAFFLIYMVLVAQFESFTVPLLIMTTMPLSFLGIMPGFAILDLGWGTFLTATSLIGFIALMGIVVNNAIIYLEYFYVLLDKGVEFQTALVKAGKNRLRPILLTSATTILGNLTIVTDPVWSGLAWSIVFGLSISSILTLGVFPLLYDTFRPKRHD
ncbi:MAG: efflux RND transporter permease subunit [Candidatus Peregrinibacteria bacterium]|nr:efflux RND transporter permease subunit [Candidatus Peregrinibacteria bacterium]